MIHHHVYRVAGTVCSDEVHPGYFEWLTVLVLVVLVRFSPF